MTAAVDVVVTYLDMKTPAQLRPAATVSVPPLLRRESPPEAVQLASQLYRLVGEGYHWLDRLDWSEGKWQSAIDHPDTEVWTAREGEDVVGYFELARSGVSADIRYFGLAPGWIGRGLGGWLLTEAVRRAWQLGAPSVTVNTCSLDGPAALPNYLARGFRVVREVHQQRELTR